MSKRKKKPAGSPATNKKNSDPRPILKNNYQENIYQKILKYGWMALLIILPLLRGKTVSSPKFFVSLACILILTTIASIGLIKKKLSWPKFSMGKTILFYLIICGISTLASASPWLSFVGNSTDFHIGYLPILMQVLLFSIIIISQPSKEDLKKFLEIFTFVGIWIAIQAIFEYHGWLHIGEYKRAASRAIGFLQNSDFTLSYMLYILPLTIYHFFTQKEKYLKYVYTIATLLVIYAIFLLTPETVQAIIAPFMFSKFGLLAIILIIAAGFSIYRSKLKQHLLSLNFKKFLIIAAALIVILIGLILGPAKNTASNFMHNQSNAMRFWAWQAGLSIGKDHLLLGIGPGNLSNYLPAYQHSHPFEHWDYNASTSNTHNEAIDNFVQFGIFGLIGYLLLWGALFYYLIKSILRNDENKKLYLALFWSFLLFFGFNQLIFSSVGTMYLPWLTAAIMLSLSGEINYERKFSLPKIWRQILILIAITSGSFLTYWSIRYWSADYYLGRGMKNQNDFNDFRTASNLFPLSDKFLLYDGFFNYYDNLIVLQKAYGQKFSQSQQTEILTDSLEKLEKAIKLDPNSPTNWIKYGNLQLAAGKTKEAEKSFTKAIEIDPYNPLTCLDISGAYQNENEPEKTKIYLDEALSFNDGHTFFKIYFAYGQYYLAQNDYVKALEKLNLAKKYLFGVKNSQLDYLIKQAEQKISSPKS